MAISPDQIRLLTKEVETLRNANQSAVPSLIEIANKLGLRVWLKGERDTSKRQCGFLQYGTQPRIILRCHADFSFEREILAAEENLLGPRDRFTLAHEVGHWLAYQMFAIGPARDHSEYWRDEAAVNQVASKLLLPDWLVDEKLRQIG